MLFVIRMRLSESRVEFAPALPSVSILAATYAARH